MRPKTKDELLEAADQKFAGLWKQIATLSLEEQQGAFLFDELFLSKKKEAHWQRDKDLKDILIHLYEWHQLLLHWIQNNQKGKEVSFLPEPFNWRTYGEMNVGFVNKHRSTHLDEAKSLLCESHEQVMALIAELTNEELFEKNYFDWAGNMTLGSYFVSSTSSHYDWAIKKIKQFQKLKRKG